MSSGKPTSKSSATYFRNHNFSKLFVVACDSACLGDVIELLLLSSSSFLLLVGCC